MPSDLPNALRELAEMQSGVISRQQARNAGVSSDAIVWRLRRGRWQQVQRGVYAVFSGRPDRHAELLGEPRGGVHSVLEYRYFRDVERAHRLPRSARQVRVASGGRVRYRDALYAEFLVLVELDGQLAYPRESRWLDIRRDNAAAAEGSVTLRYGWADVTSDPCRTAAEITQVLAARGWAGVPRPCCAACDLHDRGRLSV